jgi:hypothetical protein
MFKIAIRKKWQGLSYILITTENPYDFTLAMQDALTEGKIQLVLTLLAKTNDASIICKSNAHNQNLFHILAKYGGQESNFNLV